MTLEDQHKDRDNQQLANANERELFSWKAPARPFKRRDREYWVSILAIAGVIGLIILIIEGVMPVILIVALVFLFYILSTVEPEEIEYKITNYGIKIAGNTTHMDTLTRFWFGERFGTTLLIFGMVVFPSRLELVVNKKDKDKIRKALEPYIIEEKSPPSNIERAADWFSKKLPGNK